MYAIITHFDLRYMLNLTIKQKFHDIKGDVKFG
nr:MAG TPA: hypothetical protein [Caudoviricetes sp.]